MPFLADRVLDLGLNVLDTEADRIYINNAEPATFSAATTTNALGNKTFSAGGAFGAPTAGTPNGRKVDSTAITDGVVTANGTASHYSVVDFANSRLLAASNLSASQGVTSGNSFSLGSFAIRIPAP